MAQLKNYILVINAGSATLKFKIFHQDTFEVKVSGAVERIGSAGSFLNIEDQTNGKRMIMKNYPEGIPATAEALKIVFKYIAHWQRKIKIIGHRVVHGGQVFFTPVVVNNKVFAQLKSISQLAPLHNPVNLSCIKVCSEIFPSIKNVAVFDTAFYKAIPDYAFLYAIPYKYYTDLGIRRYGFHGISHQYATEQAATKIKKPLKKSRLITCHLGSGNSLSAIKFGKAIENSMGFTPLEGLTMGTRSGDIDPSVAFFLMRKLGLNINQIETILNQQSGLKGIFSYSNDMRDILTAAGYKVKGYKAPKKFNRTEINQAKLALAMYVYDIVRYIGGYVAIMGGIDYIVFTGGIGERSDIIRNLIMREVRKSIKKVKTLVIPANEELMIARSAKRLIS